MGLYHFHVDVLSRSSGRSAVGAAAYQAAEKLHATAYVAYQSGEKIIDKNDQILHDYTRKTGVVHKEIMLPENAPKEFADRETLWNAVENREKRVDSRLMREIDVALQVEFTLQENITLLQEFIVENFVGNGMIADFAVHDKGDGNPHAHIKLTLRDVTVEGFGKANRDWNRTAELVSWRENWAGANNRVFERLGLDERIDHRSYRARGIDREPTIHLGHEAAALERRGIRIEKGDHNREVMRRNEERATQKELETLKVEKTEQYIDELDKLEWELQKIRETQQTMQYIEIPLEVEPETPFISELEKDLKAEKAIQHLENMQIPRDAEKIAKHMHTLKEKYFALEKERVLLMETHNAEKHVLPPLEYRAESMEIHVDNLEILQGRVAQLRESRRSLSIFDFKRKSDTEKKIMQTEQEITKAREFFKNRFHIDPAQASAKLKRLQEEICIKRDDLHAKQVLVQAIRKKQDAIELEYHTQKLLNESRPDHQEITHLLEKMNSPPESTREKRLHEQVNHSLNTIAEENFQKVIENLPPYQAHILINAREQAKKHERQIEVERKRPHTFERER